jgi:glutathione S-transferase
MERELRRGQGFLAGETLTLADFFMLPTLTGLSLTAEGRKLLACKTRIEGWRARMDALPAVQVVRAQIAPYLGQPVEHAREWAVSHRPRY